MTDIMNPTLTLAARTIEREPSRAGYAMMFAASDTSVKHEKRAIAPDGRSGHPLIEPQLIIRETA